jgi:RNA polymerase sigma factor (sigma-70 family)
MKNNIDSKQNNSDEKELVKKYLNGDTRAFTTLFKTYKPIFFTNAIKWYGNNNYNNEEIEDMAMEFLGRISSKLHLYDPEKSIFGTWITNSMKNFMIECQRKRTRQKIIPSNKKISFDEIITEPSINETYKNIEIKTYRKLIKMMVESLGSDDTRIFNEIFLKGRTKSEVAKEMGIIYSTLEYRIKRVKRRLEKFRPEDM